MMERFLFDRLACDEKLPSWQKAALHCWGKMDRRGHCPMPKGELTKMLGKKSDVDTRKVVNIAVDRGWLAVGSNDRCLIAPYGVEYNAGKFGEKRRAMCEFH